MAKSIAPEFWSDESGFFQVLPPSLVLKTPLSAFGEYKCPTAATQISLLFSGFTTILPM